MKVLLSLMAVMFVFAPLTYAGKDPAPVHSVDCLADANGICLDEAILGVPIVTSATSQGPAPNSGDGIRDGSGFVHPPSSGGAPNSGDGISDGSGW